MRKMRICTGKFKGKIPLIVFEIGEVGHFAAKCPHKNEVLTKGRKGPRKFNKQSKKKWFKKSFFSKEDNSSSDEDSDNGETKEYFLWPIIISKKHLTKKKR